MVVPSIRTERSRSEREMEGTTHLISPSKLFSFAFKGKQPLKQEFERTAIPHLSHIYSAALYLTNDEQEAQDLVQETYLRAYRFFHKFNPDTNCRAWVLSIQRRLFINRYKRKKREPKLIDWEKIDEDYEAMVLQDGRAETCNPEMLFCSRAMGAEVEDALKALPDEFRSAIILVDIEELSYEEAGTVMECPVGTVRSRLSRGRRMLQVALKNYALEKGLTKK
jgi:RNA polymerase sigma-70 factor (ECF subfamily)